MEVMALLLGASWRRSQRLCWVLLETAVLLLGTSLGGHGFVARVFMAEAIV